MSVSKEDSFVEVDDVREIFRHVSPYIIRQWKEVCQRLGLQELELTHLELNGYHSSKAHLAFKGLCLWYDHAGKSATKEKLVSALKQCGLHRAVEEIERLELRKLKVCSCLVRPNSRQLSATRRRPGTAQRELNGCVSRPPTRNGSASSSKRVSSSKGRCSFNKGINGCELDLRISVTQIVPAKEFIGVWREKFKEMTDTFYEAILTNTDIHMTNLENAISIREISVTDILEGSLRIRLKILTLGALESLNQIYKTRRLLAICQSVFVTENSLKTIGAKSVGIKVELSTEILDQCRDFFLSRKFKESIHPTDTLNPPSFEEELFSDDVKAIEDVFNDKWRSSVSDNIRKIMERNAQFEETKEDFIRTLNIIMPKDQCQIQSLTELLELYSCLNKTYGVSSGVRVDLLREYLLNVNRVRLVVEEIKTKLHEVVQSGADCSEGLSSIVQCLVDDLNHMLQKDTLFDEDLSVLNRQLSPSEKPFSGLVCFIPLLLAKLSTVLTTLTPNLQEQENVSE